MGVGGAGAAAIGFIQTAHQMVRLALYLAVALEFLKCMYSTFVHVRSYLNTHLEPASVCKTRTTAPRPAAIVAPGGLGLAVHVIVK